MILMKTKCACNIYYYIFKFSLLQGETFDTYDKAFGKPLVLVWLLL